MIYLNPKALHGWIYFAEDKITIE